MQIDVLGGVFFILCHSLLCTRESPEMSPPTSVFKDGFIFLTASKSRLFKGRLGGRQAGKRNLQWQFIPF